MPPMAFEYLEIRPCIETKGETSSYLDEDEFEREVARLASVRLRQRVRFKTYWTLYGRYLYTNGDFLAMGIGDFDKKDDASAVLDAIVAPMAQARDALLEAGQLLDIARSGSFDDVGSRRAYLTAVADVTNDLTDFIAQSSNRERL